MFVVEFERRPRDLGVSVIVLAHDRIEALRKAWRWFPEYKRLATGGQVRECEYAEIDWENGRSFVATRRVRLRIPKLGDERVGKEDEGKGGDKD